MYSLVSLMDLIARRVRGTRDTEIIVTNVDVWCGCVASTIHDLVEAADCFNSGGNSNAAGE